MSTFIWATISQFIQVFSCFSCHPVLFLLSVPYYKAWEILQATETESVSELPLDYVIANGLDMKGIEGKSMACTSCKAKENAISRCSDCANFLCPNCVTAHQFMRCFENHKVSSKFVVCTGQNLGCSCRRFYHGLDSSIWMVQIQVCHILLMMA